MSKKHENSEELEVQAEEPRSKTDEFKEMLAANRSVFVNKNVETPGPESDDAKGFTPEQRELLSRAHAAIRHRFEDRRLKHSLGVERTAARLARMYDVDVFSARIAGVLHDWNKELPADELIEQGKKIGFDFPEGHERDVVSLLHAPTGAVALKEEFPELAPEVLQAISRHTTGAPDMTDLDMLVYVADMIEPGRSYATVGVLRDLAGAKPLPDLYRACYASTMVSLFDRRHYVYPAAIEIWNDLVTSDGGGRDKDLLVHAVQAEAIMDSEKKSKKSKKAKKGRKKKSKKSKK